MKTRRSIHTKKTQKKILFSRKKKSFTRKKKSFNNKRKTKRHYSRLNNRNRKNKKIEKTEHYKLKGGVWGKSLRLIAETLHPALQGDINIPEPNPDIIDEDYKKYLVDLETKYGKANI